MRLGLDLDGVVYHWEKTARYMLRLYRGVSVEESQHWDYIKDHCQAEDWRWLWDDGVKLGLFRHGHLYKGTIEAVERLAKTADLVVITSRPKSAVADTLDFLSYHRLPVSEVHILGPAQRKSSVPACHFYVDDSADNAIDLLKHTRGHVLLWDRPWNRKPVQRTSPEPRFHVVKSWDEVVTVVEDLALEGVAV